ncbi:MAG: carboxylesterase [Rhodothermia bacterium]|nr:carboxylesterase [Rhodothermia bacterium]
MTTHQYHWVEALHPHTAYTLVLLHGTGGDETQLLSYGAAFGAEVNILGVRGNVLEAGMPRYFERIATGILNEDDLIFRATELKTFLLGLASEYGFDPQKMVALGYSNGANIAGGMLQLFPDFWAGIVQLRPMIPLVNMFDFSTYRQAPVLILAGSHDPLAPEGETEDWAMRLQKNGFQAEHYTLHAGHGVTAYDLDLALDWFKRHFQTN